MNRREQILAASARLFRERGYDGVGIDDIGQAVGISGPAIYKHFRGKGAILEALVDHSTTVFTGLLDEGVTPEATLEDLAAMLVDACIAHPDLVAIYTRGEAAVPEDRRGQIVAQTDRLARAFSTRIRELRPGIGPAEARIRSAGATGIATLVLTYDSPLPPETSRDLLISMMVATMTEPPVVEPVTRTVPRPPRPAGGPPAPRRDRVLEQAVRLFRRHGFPATTVEAIGAAAGIDQSSVYRHYSGKREILRVALEMAATQLDDGVRAVDERGVGDAERVELLLESYVDAALANSPLISVWATESVYLSGDDGARLRRQQRAHIAVWVDALRSRWPHLDPARAELITRAVFGATNACVSIPRRGGLSTARLRDLLCQSQLISAERAATR